MSTGPVHYSRSNLFPSSLIRLKPTRQTSTKGQTERLTFPSSKLLSGEETGLCVWTKTKDTPLQQWRDGVVTFTHMNQHLKGLGAKTRTRWCCDDDYKRLKARRFIHHCQAGSWSCDNMDSRKETSPPAEQRPSDTSLTSWSLQPQDVCCRHTTHNGSASQGVTLQIILL